MKKDQFMLLAESIYDNSNASDTDFVLFLVDELTRLRIENSGIKRVNAMYKEAMYILNTSAVKTLQGIQ